MAHGPLRAASMYCINSCLSDLWALLIAFWFHVVIPSHTASETYIEVMQLHPAFESYLIHAAYPTHTHIHTWVTMYISMKECKAASYESDILPCCFQRPHAHTHTHTQILYMSMDAAVKMLRTGIATFLKNCNFLPLLLDGAVSKYCGLDFAAPSMNGEGNLQFSRFDYHSHWPASCNGNCDIVFTTGRLIKSREDSNPPRYKWSIQLTVKRTLYLQATTAG